jgi:hypothetical protein
LFKSLLALALAPVANVQPGQFARWVIYEPLLGNAAACYLPPTGTTSWSAVMPAPIFTGIDLCRC